MVDIISVDFETGAVTGGIDKFWDEEHKMREEKTMTRPGLDQATFRAAVDEGKNVSELSRLFNVSWQTAQKHLNKYNEEKAALAQMEEQARSAVTQMGMSIFERKDDEQPAAGETENRSDDQVKESAPGEPKNIVPDIDAGDPTLTDVLLHELKQSDNKSGLLDNGNGHSDNETAPNSIESNPVNYIDPDVQEMSAIEAFKLRHDLAHDINCIDELLNNITPDLLTFRIREAMKLIREDFVEQVDHIGDVLGKTMITV